MKIRKLWPFLVMALYVLGVVFTVQASIGGSPVVYSYSTSVFRTSVYTNSVYKTSVDVVTTGDTVTISSIPGDVESLEFSTYQVVYATYDKESNSFVYHLTEWAYDALVETGRIYSTEEEALADIYELVNGASGTYNSSVTWTPSVGSYLNSVYTGSVYTGSVTVEQNTIVNVLAAYIASSQYAANYGYDANWSYTTGSDTATANLPVGAFLVIPSASNYSFMNMLVSVDATAYGSGNLWNITAHGAVLKGNKVAITKEVEEGTSSTANASSYATAQVGETVTYTIKVDVPKFAAEYTNGVTNNITFTVVDSPMNVQIDLSSVTVTGYDASGNSTTLNGSGSPQNYSASLDTDNKKVLTVDFSNYYLSTFYNSTSGTYPYDYIIITYQAEVLSSAYTETGNTNSVTVTYGDSNHPNNTATANANVYTYELTLTKYGVENSTSIVKELSDAGFQLYTVDETTGEITGPIEFIQDGNTYIVADSGFKAAGNTVTTIYTGADGTLNIRGLDESQTYIILETVAPSGYSLNGNVLTFTINIDQTTGKANSITIAEYALDNGNIWTTSVAQGYTPSVFLTSVFTSSISNMTWASSVYTTSIYAKSVYTQSIMSYMKSVYIGSVYTASIYESSVFTYNFVTLSLNDTKIPSMPSTGSTGIIIFTIFGVALMVMAVYLMFSSKGKNKEKEISSEA